MTAHADVVVAGGGPAGLALAAGAARRGLSVVVVERRALPADKACGEGILPAGVRALDALGVLDRIPRADASRIARIRWIEPDGESTWAALPAPGGLTVRRTALSAALARAAQDAGATVLHGEVISHRRHPGGVDVEVQRRGAAGERASAVFRGAVLVAADGLASPIRRREGLDRPARGPRRFGVRRHFSVAPWSDEVEVWFGRGVEAYVTPVGPDRVGVAFLFERRAGRTHDELLARFPPLACRLVGAPTDSEPRGAGPLARRSSARVRDRLVLLGDAAGYVDAVTGEGLSLAFGCAADLAALLPEAIARGATASALAPYARAWSRRFRTYSVWTRAMLWLARHPGARRRGRALAAARPRALERVVAAAVA